jgi:protein-tyrosine phosphatase
MKKISKNILTLASFVFLSLPIIAQIKQADVVSGNNGKIVITWTYSDKETPVDIYWANTPENIVENGTPIAKAVTGTSYTLYAPDSKVQGLHTPITDKRVYYGVKATKGNAVVTAERKVSRFDNITKMGNFKPINNFRDVGGYLTTDGKRVKWGKFFRSNELGNLTDTEIAYVKQFGIGTIFDLRGAKEVKNSPDANVGADMVYYEKPTTETAAIEKDPKVRLKMWKQFAKPGSGTYDYMINSNKKYVEEYKPLYQEMFQILINKKPGIPILGHCVGGKDRTGAIYAVVLSALGVPKETIVEDYLLTGVYRQQEDDVELNFVKELNGLSDEEVELIAPAWRVYPEYINTFFKTVEEKYGSMDNYLEKECGLTPAMKAKLKDLYLEN